MNSRRMNILLCLLLSVFTIGACTREAGKTSHITIGLPSPYSKTNGSLTVGEQLTHAVINISGSGMSAPLLIVWDDHDEDENNSTPAPTSFTASVPVGSKLVQVLLVYEDSSEAMSFYYGDATKNLAAGTDSVDVNVSSVGATGIGEGQIVGRYINAGGSGPTGKVRMKYTPPGGKPAMLIERSDIFNGWFSVFSPDGVGFNYILDDGTDLFGTAVGVHTNFWGGTLPVNTEKVVRVRTPLLYREEGGPGGERRANAPRRIVAGWFGPGSNGKKVCYHNTGSAVAIPYAYASPNVSISTPIYWDAQDNNSADAYVETIPGLTTVFSGVSSASLDSDNLCTLVSLTPFTDYLSFDPDSAPNHDGVLGFNPPFHSYYNFGYRNDLNVSYSSPNLSVEYRFLPGVFSNLNPKGIDGVEIFARVLPSGFTGNWEDYRVSDEIACDRLVTQFGFKSLTTRAVSTGVLEYSVTISGGLPSGFESAYNSGDAQVIVCPYSLGSGKTYFSSAAVYYNHGSGGGGGSGGPAVKVGFYGNPLVNEGGCTSLDVALLDASDSYANPGSNPSGVVALLSISAGSNSDFLADGCGGSIISQLTIPPGQNSVRVGLQSSTGNGTFTISASDQSAALATSSKVYSIATSTAITRIEFLSAGTGASIPALPLNGCVSIKMGFYDYSGSASTYVATDFPLMGGTGISYYSNSACSAGITLVNVGITQSESPIFYVKGTQAGYTNLKTLVSSFNGDSGSFYALEGMYGLNVAAPGVPVYFDFAVNDGTVTQFACEPSTLYLKDVTGATTAATSNLNNISLNSSGGGLNLYSDAGCSIGGTNQLNVNMASGASTITFYMRTTFTSSSGSVSGNYQPSGSGPSYFGSRNFSW